MIILVVFGVARSIATAADRGAASLLLVWRVPLRISEAQLLATNDGTEAVIADANGVTARALNDGRVLWQSRSIRKPVVLATEKLIARSIDDRIVALNPRDGHRYWRSEAGGRGLSSLAADGTTIIAAFEPLDRVAAEHGKAFATTFAIDVQSGRVRWSIHLEAASARKFIFSRSLILNSASLWGEPSIEQVEIFDRNTGMKRLTQSWTEYGGFVNGAFWLVPTHDPDGYEAARYDRYESNDGAFLGRYTYAPQPARNAAGFGGRNRFASGQPVPVIISDTHVYVDVNERLYRYDNGRSALQQTPDYFDVKGELIDVIGQQPLLISDSGATLLVPNGDRSFTQHRLSRGTAATVNSAGSAIPQVLAKGDDVSYFSTFAVTANALLYRFPSECMYASTVVLVPTGGAIALCKYSLELLRIPPGKSIAKPMLKPLK